MACLAGVVIAEATVVAVVEVVLVAATADANSSRGEVIVAIVVVESKARCVLDSAFAVGTGGHWNPGMQQEHACWC